MIGSTTNGCSSSTIGVFIFIVVVFGSSYAIVAKGLQFYEPGQLLLMRFLMALSFSLVILGYRVMRNQNSFRESIKMFVKDEKKKLGHLFVAGMLTLSVSVLLITYGQKSLSTVSVLAMSPLSITSGSIFSHFLLQDERFNMKKLYSLLSALIGVGLSSVPMLRHTNNISTTSTQSTSLGYIYTVIGLIISGFGPVYLRWGAPKTDISFSVITQLISAVIFMSVFCITVYGFSSLEYCFNLPLSIWIWPIILGVFVSGFCIHGYMYLLGKIGTFGTNLLPFGQIVVGGIIGVIFLNEWSKYKSSEIVFSLTGIVFMMISLSFGLISAKLVEKPQEEPEEKTESFNEL